MFGVTLAAVAIVKVARLLQRLETLRAAAAAAEQKFRMVFDSAGIGMSIGANGMLTETNGAYQRMLGYTADEMKEMHYTQVTHPEDVGLDTPIAAEVAAGILPSYNVEKRYVRRDGEIVWVNVTVTSAEDASFGIGMIEDITARRRLEQERKQLLARTVEAAEAERIALAADLHDGPIQHLTAVTLTLDLLANKLTRGETAGATALAHRLRESIAAEMHSLRRLMTELRPPILDERGLEAALRDCADAALDGVDVGFTLESNLDGYRLAPEIETSIYRVVREALTNVRKHAGACDAKVALDVGPRDRAVRGRQRRRLHRKRQPRPLRPPDDARAHRERGRHVAARHGARQGDDDPRGVAAEATRVDGDDSGPAALGERVHFALREREVARGDVVRALRLERRLDLAADLPAPSSSACGNGTRAAVRPGSARRPRARRGACAGRSSALGTGTADSSAPVYGWRGWA